MRISIFSCIRKNRSLDRYAEELRRNVRSARTARTSIAPAVM